MNGSERTMPPGPLPDLILDRGSIIAGYYLRYGLPFDESKRNRLIKAEDVYDPNLFTYDTIRRVVSSVLDDPKSENSKRNSTSKLFNVSYKMDIEGSKIDDSIEVSSKSYTPLLGQDLDELYILTTGYSLRIPDNNGKSIEIDIERFQKQGDISVDVYTVYSNSGILSLGIDHPGLRLPYQMKLAQTIPGFFLPEAA